jgi:hypothetical protein
MLITFKELAQATAVGDPCELFPGQELAVLVDCPSSCGGFSFVRVVVRFTGRAQPGHE